MRAIRQYQVDAFTTQPFSGNPAAVCLLDAWPDDALLQAIAAENNLSETAFVAAGPRGYRLRWFTPRCEVDLCGHATLATAHVLFETIGVRAPLLTFETRSGDLRVRRLGSRLELDFPAIALSPVATPELLSRALGAEPVETLAADIYVAVFDDEAAIRALTPDFGLVAGLDLRAVCVTAPGQSVDFVSRYFAPRMGVPEDPVTGSAHCKLVPYWAGRLGRHALEARQLSARGGELSCRLAGDRVLIAGNAVTVMEATFVPSIASASKPHE